MRLFAVDYLQTSPGPADFFADAGAGVQSLLSASGRFNVNRKASLIQVTDFADRLDLVAAYLESAQLRVNRQVRIDTRVFEVARPDGRPVDWSDLASRQGGGVQKTAGAPGWRVDDVETLFSALGGAATVRQIAAPTLLAMNPPIFEIASSTSVPRSTELAPGISTRIRSHACWATASCPANASRSNWPIAARLSPTNAVSTRRPGPTMRTVTIAVLRPAAGPSP